MSYSNYYSKYIKVTYDRVSDKDRIWIAFPVGSIRQEATYIYSLKMIEYLEYHSIPWTDMIRTTEFDNQSLSIVIPILTAWEKYKAFQCAIHHDRLFQFGKFVFRDSQIYGDDFIDWNDFLSDGKLLRYGRDLETPRTLYSNYDVTLPEYLEYASGFSDCFEEVFYLYHCGAFDTYSPEYIDIVRKYINSNIDKPANKGKYVKILY